MDTPSDFFFGPYITPQEQRLRAVARNGVAHASEIAPGDPEPGQPVTLAIITDARLGIDRVGVYYTTDGAEPQGARGRPACGQVTLALPLAQDIQDGQDAQDGEQVGEAPIRRWRAIVPAQPDGTLVRYRIDAWDSADPATRWLADAVDPIGPPAPGGREFAYHVDRRDPPEWFRDAVVYHIFVDRFAAARDQAEVRESGSLTDYRGGALRGVTEKLDYITDLGVNCLWLSPVMESPTYHGYNPTSYRAVARRLGSDTDLRTLIEACHARGVRVLLDFVANHTSNEHPQFVAAQRGDAAARGWYVFDAAYPNGYLAFFEVEGMPVLNTDADGVRAYLAGEALHWLRDLGADGLRLDNVSGPAHGFWTDFQERVKREQPGALTLGEVTGSMTDIATYAGRLDGLMDFPLTREMRRVFALRETPLAKLLDGLAAHEAALPARMVPARLLDNHDMTRFLWLAGNDTRRLQLALAFLLSISGVPIVYYGTEIGLSQRDGPPGQDAYAREPMVWDDRQRTVVLDRARWLIARRRSRASLRRGAMARIPLSVECATPDEVGALARWDNEQVTVVVFNNSDSVARFSIGPLGAPYPARPDARVEGYLLTPDVLTPLAGLRPERLAGALPAMSAAMILMDGGAAN